MRDSKTTPEKQYWADKLRKRNTMLKEIKQLQKKKPAFVGTPEECLAWLNRK